MARRFQFRLETVLRVRELRKREAQRKFSLKQAEIARVDQLNAETQGEIDRQRRELVAAQSGTLLDTREIARLRAWIRHLELTLTQRQVQREQLAGELEQLKRELREARKQTRILENLRERRFDEYRRRARRTEQAHAEELAQQLHHRRGEDEETFSVLTIADS